LIVNILGAFILGMFIILSAQWNLDGKYSLLIAIGFCGSFTTMSSLALDSSNLLDNHHYGTLVVNLIANIGLSIGALIGGKSLMTVIVNG
jgi:CrcB protein